MEFNWDKNTEMICYDGSSDVQQLGIDEVTNLDYTVDSSEASMVKLIVHLMESH